jgi:two-component system chemotaxis family response regulator WspR
MADELQARARDDLTGLPNFRAFSERINAGSGARTAIPERSACSSSTSIASKYNDNYGHLAGSDALRRVAQTIRETVRTVDFPARYDGEEFAVIVPQVDASSLGAIAERVRANVERLPAPKDGAAVTVSIGAALFPLDGADRESLFRTADERLYAAKNAGRNRVVLRVKTRRSR